MRKPVFLALTVFAITMTDAQAEPKPCKTALNRCLTKFNRGPADVAECNSAYAQAAKTGYWPAHPSTNSPGFACKK